METGIFLNDGESVVLKNDEIGYGGGLSRKNNELILTNQSLILQKRSFFGKAGEVIRFPLTDVAISDNQAQVRLGKSKDLSPSLDVYFKTGMESFRFTWEDEVKDWANSINALLTGRSDLYNKDAWIDDISLVADKVTGAVKKIRRVFGIKSTEQVSCKCPSCGAALTGTEGETVRCPYCASPYTF